MRYLNAIDAATGAVLWKAFLGATRPYFNGGCYDMPTGVWGIGGTPIIDVQSGLIYAVSNGYAHARLVADGSAAPGWPLYLFDPLLNHNYGGLALLNNVLYVTVASHCDIAPFYGAVLPIHASVDVAAGVRPAVLNSSTMSPFYPIPVANQSEYYAGGIWGSGGVVIAPVAQLGGGASLFVSIGNAAAFGNESGGNGNPAVQALFLGESVVRLSPSLAVQTHFKSPAIYNSDDNDIGASPAVFTPSPSSGCGVTLSVAEQKAGLLVVNDAATQANIQELQVSSSGGDGFQTTPTYDAVRNLLYVANQQDGDDPSFGVGLLAFAVTPSCVLSLAWRCDATSGASTRYPWTSPTLANGVVYVGTGGHRTVAACSADTGELLWSAAVTTGDALSSPIVANGVVYAPDFTYGAHGTIYAWALPSVATASLKTLHLNGAGGAAPPPEGASLAPAPPAPRSSPSSDRRVSPASSGVIAAASAVVAAASIALGVRLRRRHARRIPAFPAGLPKNPLFRGAGGPAGGKKERIPAFTDNPLFAHAEDGSRVAGNC